MYNKTTGEIIYKPDTDGSNVDFIYENLIKTGVYNEAAGGWSYIFIDLDTKRVLNFRATVSCSEIPAITAKGI